MDTAQTMDGKDQATGLRNLFGHNAAPVHVLHCPARPALSLPLVHGLSKDLAERGHTVIWIDEIAFADRESWPLPCKVKFDLSKTLQNHVALDQGVTPLSPTLWYGLSLHTARIAQPTTPLSQRLLGSGIRFDSVIVSGGAKQTEGLSHYGSPLHYTVITECDAPALQKTMGWMQLAQAQCPAASWSVVLAGSKARLASGTKWIEQTASVHLNQPVKLLGSVDAKLMTAPLTGAWTSTPDLTDLMMHHLLIG